jgi:DNA-binding NarL/FixJ family response regulator/PAS domain-containing protein
MLPGTDAVMPNEQHQPGRPNGPRAPACGALGCGSAFAEQAGIGLLWRLLTRVTHCGVTITNRDGTIVYLNEENRRSLDRRSPAPISDRRPLRVEHYCPPAMAAERLGFIRRVCDEGVTLVYESIDAGRRDLVTLTPAVGWEEQPAVMSICRPMRSAERVMPQNFPECEIVFARDHFAGGLALLSPRELEVLVLVGEGHAYPEIAGILGCSGRTVERHRDNICSKLGIVSRLEVAGFAINAGLADPSRPEQDAVLSLAQCDPLEFSDTITHLARGRRGPPAWVRGPEPRHPADFEAEERQARSSAEGLGAARLWRLLTLHSGCCVTVTDRDGSIAYANPRSLAWLGWRDRYRSAPTDATPAHLGRCVAPEMVAERLAFVRRVCDEGVCLAYESINDGLRDLISLHPIPAPHRDGYMVLSVSRRLRAWERVDGRVAPDAAIVHPEHHEPGALAFLSPRELEVLVLVGEGFSYAEIGRTLHRSQRTVERHRDSICKKLGITTRLEIARFAIRAGLAEMCRRAENAAVGRAGNDPAPVSAEVSAIARRRVRRADDARR